MLGWSGKSALAVGMRTPCTHWSVSTPCGVCGSQQCPDACRHSALHTAIHEVRMRAARPAVRAVRMRANTGCCVLRSVMSGCMHA
eukprot:363736-Chlamydomonas_euryale.AAC.13